MSIRIDPVACGGAGAPIAISTPRADEKPFTVFQRACDTLRENPSFSLCPISDVDPNERAFLSIQTFVEKFPKELYPEVGKALDKLIQTYSPFTFAISIRGECIKIYKERTDLLLALIEELSPVTNKDLDDLLFREDDRFVLHAISLTKEYKNIKTEGDFIKYCGDFFRWNFERTDPFSSSFIILCIKKSGLSVEKGCLIILKESLNTVLRFEDFTALVLLIREIIQKTNEEFSLEDFVYDAIRLLFDSERLRTRIGVEPLLFWLMERLPEELLIHVRLTLLVIFYTTHKEVVRKHEERMIREIAAIGLHVAEFDIIEGVDLIRLRAWVIGFISAYHYPIDVERLLRLLERLPEELDLEGVDKHFLRAAIIEGICQRGEDSDYTTIEALMSSIPPDNLHKKGLRALIKLRFPGFGSF